MSYIIYVADTETTGLDPKKNEIIELSIGRLYLNKPDDFEIKTWLLKANDPSTVEDKALKISGHKRDDILHLSKFGRENYLVPNDTLPEIENWIAEDSVSAKDRILAGQNILFDYNMMYELWLKEDCVDTFPFITGHNVQLLDTKHLSMFIDVCCGKKRDRYNLGSLVKAFGVKKRTAHRAEEDMIMTKDLLLAQILPIKDVVREKFEDCY